MKIDQEILTTFTSCPRKAFFMENQIQEVVKEDVFLTEYSGMTLIAKADEVIKINGNRVAILDKSSKSVKERHRIELAFLAFVFSLRGERISVGLRLNGELRLMYPNTDKIPLILSEIKKSFSSTFPPEPSFSYTCKNCPFHTDCINFAIKNGDITMINGIGEGRKRALKKAGFLKVDDVAKSDPRAISKYTGVDLKEAKRIVKQAESISTSKWFSINEFTLPTSEFEYFFDVEKGEDKIYLLGVLLKEKSDNQYRYFILDDYWENAWKGFIDFVNIHPKAPIYHYDVFDRDVIRKFGNLSKMNVKELSARLVDLYKLIVRSFILPVRFYSLKDVARTTGFNWRTGSFSGYEAMKALSMWRESKNPDILSKIVTYNEDDCRALMTVKTRLERAQMNF